MYLQSSTKKSSIESVSGITSVGIQFKVTNSYNDYFWLSWTWEIWIIFISSQATM